MVHPLYLHGLMYIILTSNKQELNQVDLFHSNTSIVAESPGGYVNDGGQVCRGCQPQEDTLEVR
jgi:hypothetical protein